MIRHGVDICKDEVAHMPIGVSYQEALINEGRLFFVKQRLEAQAVPFNTLIQTGDHCAHGISVLSSGSKVKIDIIEGVTVNAGNEGTPVTLRNYNRNYADNGLYTKIYTGATYAGGTVIRPTQSGFGTSPGLASAGISSDPAKLVFKHNTNYILLVTPSAATDIIFEGLIWEEEENHGN